MAAVIADHNDELRDPVAEAFRRAANDGKDDRMDTAPAAARSRHAPTGLTG
jgi:hypothetical protein